MESILKTGNGIDWGIPVKIKIVPILLHYSHLQTLWRHINSFAPGQNIGETGRLELPSKAIV